MSISSSCSIQKLFFCHGVVYQILEYAEHKEIAKWVQTCKFMFSYIQHYIPEFFNCGKNLEENLIESCLHGNEKQVKYLLSKDAKVLYCHDEPLQLACEKGHFNIVKILVEKGVSICSEMKEIGSIRIINFPFILACRNGHLEIAKYLVSQGIEIDENSTYFSYLFGKNTLAMIEFLYSQVKNKIHFLNTALVWACNEGLLPVVKYLISKGANDYQSINQLIFHSSRVNLDVSKYLIQNGLDVKKMDENTFFILCRNQNLELIQICVENGFNIYPHVNLGFCVSCSIQNMNMIKYFLQKGANIHCENDHGLKIAFKTANVEMLKYFISQGIDVQSKNHFIFYINDLNLDTQDLTLGAPFGIGSLETHPPTSEQKLNFINYLISQKIDIFSHSRESVHKKTLYTRKCVLPKDLVLNKTSKYLLFFSIMIGDLNLAQYLVDQGVNICLLKKQNLISICQQGNWKVIKWIIKNSRKSLKTYFSILQIAKVNNRKLFAYLIFKLKSKTRLIKW